MGGVGMRTTKWERMPLGIGRTHLEHVMDRLQSPASLDSAKIKALGKKIIMEEMSTIPKPDTAVRVQKE